MEKQKENLFSEKFRLLNSQENGENINWTCSDSSDYENVSVSERFCNITNKAQSKKRKRKKKVSKNISNLNITILDVTKDKVMPCEANVPVDDRNSEPRGRDSSPVFAPTHIYFPPNSSKITPGSPILTSKHCAPQITEDKAIKSPILNLKYASPKYSPKVRKKLFTFNNVDTEIETEDVQVKKEIPVNTETNFECLAIDRRKDSKKAIVDNYNRNVNINNQKQSTVKSSNSTKDTNIDLGNSSVENIKTELNIKEVNEEVKTEDLNADNSFENSKAALDLANKIRSYFDSHFSSENSQHSISNSLTPKHSSKTSEEFEIISSLTQLNPSRITSQIHQEELSKNVSPVSSESAEINIEKAKKIRYKKNGLAYRLNALLKKQNANISLWQHERFLADNSNFIIPKGENISFRIQKVTFKYGSYVLEAVDVNDEQFLIIIYNSYVTDVNISTDVIFKLYEPYKIVNFNTDCKLIINVCKFECVPFKKNSLTIL